MTAKHFTGIIFRNFTKNKKRKSYWISIFLLLINIVVIKNFVTASRLINYSEKENLKLSVYVILQVFSFAILWFWNFLWLQNFIPLRQHPYVISSDKVDSLLLRMCVTLLINARLPVLSMSGNLMSTLTTCYRIQIFLFLLQLCSYLEFSEPIRTPCTSCTHQPGRGTFVTKLPGSFPSDSIRGVSSN